MISVDYTVVITEIYRRIYTMEHSIAYMAGVVVGILVVAVAMYFFGRHAHTDGARKPKFDERQELVRGRGYKYAFFTLLVYLVVYGMIGYSWFAPLAGAFLGIVIGIAVYAGYTIWHDAYFALNEKRRMYIILFAVITVINGAAGISNILQGRIVENGIITGGGSINLMCAVLCMVVLVMLLIKEIASHREEE